MTPNEISRSSLLDLLFEHRNKQYGAYQLRKFYGNRMALALGVMLSVVLLLLLLVNYFSGSSGRFEPPVISTTEVILERVPQSPEPVKPEPPKTPASRPPVATQQWTNQIVLTPDENTVPDQGALDKAAISTRTSPGDAPGIGQPAPPDPAPAAQAPVAAADPAPVEEAPSAPPAFPGGMKAWADFLGRNLVATSDMQPGEKRSVLVRFWVDETGNVGRFEVLQSAGAAFDNEVLRALKRMPKWKPAVQHGRAVATSFVQPVTFQAPEE